MPATIIHKNFTGADAVHPAAYVQATDPGSVGANKFWIDTSASPTLKVRNAGNTAWITFSGATGATGATGASGTNGSTGIAGPPGTNIVSGAAPYICVREQQSYPSDGGTFTAGAWRTRTLNAFAANDQFLATLASNQITLPAGTWRCHITAPAFGTSTHVARLQNVTDSGTLARGSVEYVNTSTGTGTRSAIAGRFALSSPKALEVQHWANTTKATFGFGVGSTTGGVLDGGVDIYTIAEFWLEGPPPPFMGTTQLTENPGLDMLAARQRISRATDSSDQGAFISTSGPF